MADTVREFYGAADCGTLVQVVERRRCFRVSCNRGLSWTDWKAWTLPWNVVELEAAMADCGHALDEINDINFA